MDICYRIILLAALFFGHASTLSADPPTKERAERSETVRLFADQSGRGELAVLSLDETVHLRVQGFSRISLISHVAPNQTLVVDEGQAKIFLLELSEKDAQVTATWPLPPEALRVKQVDLLSAGELLVVSETGDTFVLSQAASRRIVVRAKGVALRIISVAFSSGDEGVAIGYTTEASRLHLYGISLSQEIASEIALPDEFKIDGGLVFQRVHVLGNRLIFSSPLTQRVCDGEYTSGKLASLSCYLLDHTPYLISYDSHGDIISVKDYSFLIYFKRSASEVKKVPLDFIPLAMTFDRHTSRVILGYERQKVNSWPEYAAMVIDSQKVIDWRSVRTIFLSSLIALLLVAVTIGWRYPARLEEPGQLSTETAVVLERNTGHYLSCVLLCLGALCLAASWCQSRVISGIDDGKGAWAYLFVALLFTGVARRAVKKIGSESSSVFGPSPVPIPSFTHRSFAILLVLVLLGISASMLSIFSKDLDLTRKTTAWFICGACVLAMLLVDLTAVRQRIVPAFLQDLGQLVILAIVTSITLGYHLETLPYSTHFDFTIPALWAWRVLTGVVVDIWVNGYTPVPVAGLFPEIAGLYLFGPTPLGFRAGSVLFGISGVVAVYLLGRAYKGSWFGFWAALFLAGNSTYMHFSRLTTCGSAITTGIWVVCLFVMAWRWRLMSLWLLMGVMAGLSVYQWPVARVSGASVAVCIILLILRYPREVLVRATGLCLALVGFLVVLAPVVPHLFVDPGLLLPRASTIDPSPSKYAGVLGWIHSAFGPEFLRCFAWFFNEPDHSSQGSLSPCLNSFEAVVFGLGLAYMLFGRSAINLVLAPLLLITLTLCGSLTRAAWYTRLFPTVLVAAICMALTFHIIYQLLQAKSLRMARVAAVLFSVLIILQSPLANLQRYRNHEEIVTTPNSREPFTAIGRKMLQLGPEFEFGIVSAGNEPWSIKNAFSLLLPYILQLRLHDVFELREVLPIAPGRKYVFIVQSHRAERDVELIKRFHPSARVEQVYDPGGFEVAQAVVLN